MDVDTQETGPNSPPPSPLPPPARPGVDWDTKGAACDTCATKRWTDCNKTGHARCTNCKLYGGSCHCNSMFDKSWQETLLDEALNRMKWRADPALCEPAPRNLNPQPGLHPLEVPMTASLPPRLPPKIQRNAFQAFEVPMPTQAELLAKKPRKQKTYGRYTPSTRGGHTPHPGFGQHQVYHQLPRGVGTQINIQEPGYSLQVSGPHYTSHGYGFGSQGWHIQIQQPCAQPQVYGVPQHQQQAGFGHDHQPHQG